MKTAQILRRDDLVALLDTVFYPVQDLPPEQIFENLLTFCMNCPDPGAAIHLTLDAPRGTLSSSVVDQAIAMPPRAIDTWSLEDIPLDHPLRHWKLAADGPR
jgi:hypothetical protein